MSSEITYYSDEEGVRITSNRAIFGNTTYAMANISSVTTAENPPSRSASILTVIIGLLSTIVGFYFDLLPLTIAGIIFILVGIVWIYLSSSIYRLLIRSSAGEVSVIASKDKNYIVKIANAINEAFIDRR